MREPANALLFLCHTLPYPPDGGVWMRTYHVLRELSRRFKISALCFERLGATGSSDDTRRSVEHLRRFAEVDVFEVPQNRSRAALAWNHARSVGEQRVYTRFIYESPEYAARLQELLRARRFDLVHVDSLDLSGYLDELGALPVVCTHHNVESALLARRADVERPWYRSAYMRMQARLMRREEDERCPRVAMNVVCSEADLRLLQAHSPSAPGAVVPNGIDVGEFQPVEGPSEGVVFVGGTSWFPNLDALEHFSTDIYPRIRERDPGCPATWVGAASPQEQARFGALGIRLTGYVEDVRPYIAGARVFVVPLRAGGGTRLKILTAWSMAAAVVTTSIGCEGLDAVDGVNCLIRDDPEAFAEAVLEVSNDAELRRALGTAARLTAERTYSWSVIGEQLVSLYERVVASPDKAGA